jgi:hypothetical protein
MNFGAGVDHLHCGRADNRPVRVADSSGEGGGGRLPMNHSWKTNQEQERSKFPAYRPPDPL